MRAARVTHPRKQGVQLIAFRGRALGLDHLAADEILVCADQSDLMPCLLQHVLDQIGRGGFSVGAGYSQHYHMICRVPEAVGSNLSECTARIRHHNRRNTLRRLLTHHGSRALLQRFADILVSVGRVTADRHKQIARLYRA